MVLKRPKGVAPEDVIFELQSILQPFPVCYLRNEERLIGALEKVERIRDDQLPKIKATNLHHLRRAIEVRSMVCIAEMILRSVLFRQESRGFVFREDFLLTDNIHWLKWVMVKKENAKPKVYATDFPTPFIQPPREVYPPKCAGDFQTM